MPRVVHRASNGSAGARFRRVRAGVRALLVATAAAVGLSSLGFALLAPKVPRDQYGYPPVNLVVTDAHGQAKNTQISALTTPLSDTSMWAYVAAQWVPNLPWIGAPEPFASGAGDSQQESARLAAWFAANSALGRRMAVGVLMSGKPEPPFQDGDVLLRIDGVPVLGATGARTAMAGGDCDTNRTARILRDGRRTSVTFPCLWLPIGVEFLAVGSETPPWDVPALDGIRGPSAGLALTLSYVDSMSAGSLTGGRRVAATGEISARMGAGSSLVLDVGSIPAKMQAARAANVDVILVPKSQEALARLHAGTTPVVGVSTVGEALAYLCATGSTSQACIVGGAKENSVE